eukprot:GEZU01013805.1.p1 GENE.GEZU01013805.1~~GEZU01013805.1.p1  ORF type:complete len:127 (+),score=6.63 GEZU01013805.1:116-496(+)
MSAGWSSRFSRMRAAFNHNNNNFASNTYSQSSNAFEPATNNRRMVAQTVAKSYLAPWQSQRIDEDEKEDLYSNNGRMRRHARDAQNSSDEDEVSSEEGRFFMLQYGLVDSCLFSTLHTFCAPHWIR